MENLGFNIESSLSKYFSIMKDRPEEFLNSGLIDIVKDLQTLVDFHRSTNIPIGVIYESPYNILVVDVIKSSDGTLYTYERVIKSDIGTPVVAITTRDGKFLLLNQFRHAMRCNQLSFVRGHGMGVLSEDGTISVEIVEELGVQPKTITKLGEVVADSGLSGTLVSVFSCEVSTPIIKEEYEGIKGYIELTQEELEQYINEGKITDCFTLSAFLLYKLRRS